MASRKQTEVRTTVDNISDYTARVSISGGFATVVNSTDSKTTVTGSGGTWTVTLGADNNYPQIYGYNGSVETATAYTGIYSVAKVGSTTGSLSLKLLSGSAPAGNGLGTAVATAPPAAALVIDFAAKFRNTNRSR